MRKNNFKIIRKVNTAQAMVEFLIILPVMLLLVMGTIQFAFIYQAKHTLNYATFHTARAGTINNLSMSAMEMAFASNMAPLYTHSYWVMGDPADECTSSFTESGRSTRLSGAKIMQDNIRSVLDKNINNFMSDDVLCARKVVQKQIEDGYVNITVHRSQPVWKLL